MSIVFVDVDTQFDFLLPAGALYVPGAERIVPTVAKLNRYAVAHGIPLVSTVDAHQEDDPEFGQWPPHCVKGTLGQRKAPETVLGQPVLEKRAIDIFSDQELLRSVLRLNGAEFFVYGVATEYCVRQAALGLRAATGKPVTIVIDAIEGISPEGAEETIRDLIARGCRTAAASEVGI
jgi:nicotinamidase/pyrazinamidase